MDEARKSVPPLPSRLLPEPWQEQRCSLCGCVRFIRRSNGTAGLCSGFDCPDPWADVRAENEALRARDMGGT